MQAENDQSAGRRQTRCLERSHSAISLDAKICSGRHIKRRHECPCHRTSSKIHAKVQHSLGIISTARKGHYLDCSSLLTVRPCHGLRLLRAPCGCCCWLRNGVICAAGWEMTTNDGQLTQTTDRPGKLLPSKSPCTDECRSLSLALAA